MSALRPLYVRQGYAFVGGQGDTVASTLTTNTKGDPTTVPLLIAQLTATIACFTADGAYDTQIVHDAMGKRERRRCLLKYTCC